MTALWNTNAFFAYILTVKLFHLHWEPHRLAAVILATLGAAAVVYGGSSVTAPEDKTRDLKNSPHPLVGDALTLAASVVYGVYQVMYKMYAAFPSDPEGDLDGLPVEPSYEPVTDSADEDYNDLPSDKSEMVYPPPFALYANFLTTCIGLCTFVLLWIPIPFLHISGAEAFHLPPDLTTVGVIAAISLSGVAFNAGLMVSCAFAIGCFPCAFPDTQCADFAVIACPTLPLVGSSWLMGPNRDFRREPAHYRTRVHL